MGCGRGWGWRTGRRPDDALYPSLLAKFRRIKVYAEFIDVPVLTKSLIEGAV